MTAQTPNIHRWRAFSLLAVAAFMTVMDLTIVNTALPTIGRELRFSQIALDFPELVIVGGHIGYRWTEEMIAVARKHENVYIDTSAYTAGRYPRELVAYMKSGSGRQKVMFRTNYPMVLPQQALKDLDDLGLDGEARELFLAGNA